MARRNIAPPIPCSHCGNDFRASSGQRYWFRKGLRAYCKPECRQADLFPMSFMDRVFSRIDKDGPVPDVRPDLGPCWLWTGAKRVGYGHMHMGDTRRHAHILTYEYFRGPVPEDLELDHLCRNPACCNPWHLEAVTHLENLRRGMSPVGINLRKTECIRGHKLPDGPGWRYCKPCKIIYQREYRAKKKLVAAASALLP